MGPCRIILAFDPGVSRTKPDVIPLITGELEITKHIRAPATAIVGVCENRPSGH